MIIKELIFYIRKETPIIIILIIYIHKNKAYFKLDYQLIKKIAQSILVAKD